MIPFIRNLLLVAVICVSCTDNKSYIKREVYEGGQLKSETEILENKWHGKRVKYYPCGKIEAISYFKEGKNHGEVIGYYKNGIIQAKEIYQNGRLHGEAKYFFPSGILKQLIFYKNGFQVGWGRFYRPDGSLKTIGSVVYKDGKEEENQVIKYNQEGKILKDSSYYVSLSRNCDTLSLGDTCRLIITLETPMMNKDMRLLIGGYNEFYSLVDKKQQDTVTGRNFRASYQLVASKKGVNVIRGRVDDFKEQFFENSDTVSIRNERNIFFSKSFYVK